MCVKFLWKMNSPRARKFKQKQPSVYRVILSYSNRIVVCISAEINTNLVMNQTKLFVETYTLKSSCRLILLQLE